MAQMVRCWLDNDNFNQQLHTIIQRHQDRQAQVPVLTTIIITISKLFIITLLQHSLLWLVHIRRRCATIIGLQMISKSLSLMSMHIVE